MDLKFILESILFSAQQPLTPKELRDLLVTAADHDESGGARAFKKTPVENIIAALEELARDHEAAARSYRLVCVAGAWQFASQPEFAPWLKALVGHRNRPPRLSAPALETLAIIAYRQPITRAEIEQVRGVAVDGVMQTLLERALVEHKGRAEVVGRPNTYGTTPAFLEYFGLKDLDDLPAADELRRIPVTKPDSLLTVDPGLATAPPELLALAGNSGGDSGDSPAVSPAKSRLPLAGRNLPADESNLPADESNLPADESNLPADESNLPADERKLPAGERKDESNPLAVFGAEENLPPEGRNLPPEGRNLPLQVSDLPDTKTKVAPARRKNATARVQVAQGSIQVSPSDSELPPTSGTATARAAGDNPAAAGDATETTSAEPPPKNRLARRKKDTGSEN